MVWCRACYVEHPKDDIPNSRKYHGRDLEGDLEEIYEKGGAGYHMLSYFQCDLCQFQNMKGRYLTYVIQEY